MAQSLVAQQPKKVGVEYKIGETAIALTPEIVKNYLVSGDTANVTTQELVMFMNLCKYQALNPWTKEAYCVKYGNKPATIVVGKEAFTKRAESCPDYDGSASGVIVCDEEGEIKYRNGAFALPTEKIVGGWAEVYRKGRTHSSRVEVSFDEYVGKKSDGTANSNWATRPATMIRKVALVQALREAFPNNLGGMYIAEEQGMEEGNTTVIVEQPASETIETEVAETPSTADIANSLFS